MLMSDRFGSEDVVPGPETAAAKKGRKGRSFTVRRKEKKERAKLEGAFGADPAEVQHDRRWVTEK